MSTPNPRTAVPAPSTDPAYDEALDHRARETWWSLLHMSYTGNCAGVMRPDLGKEDIEEIALLIRDLAIAARAEATDA